MAEKMIGAPYDAREIANFFLDHAEEKGVALTIMPLIKLIYFAHGWHLARFDRPLVKNEFEAWQYGPVVRVVYESFPDARDKLITSRAEKFTPLTGSHSVAKYQVADYEREFLTQIFGAYAHLHAFKLSSVTHEPGSPWDEIWQASDEAINPGMRIADARIKSHFLRRHQDTQEH